MKNGKPTLIKRIGRILGRHEAPVAKATGPAPTKRPLSDEDDGTNFPHLPTREKIHVVEIDSAEFVQEWGRSLTGNTAPQDGSGEDLLASIDRRLPKFDRRNPGHKRRSGDGHDRRGISQDSPPGPDEEPELK